jgi:purine-binding chemotaxis protein CheW
LNTLDDKSMNDNQETKTNHSRIQIVVFRLGSEEFGLHIDQIKEVVITPTITRMPQMPSFIKGVANIRGSIIAILDLNEKFNLNKAETIDLSTKTFTLVIESEEYKMGLLVKEVPNTLSISPAEIEDSIFTGDSGEGKSYVKGIVKLDKRLIIMIDVFKVFSEQEAQAIFKKQAVTA